MRLRTFHWLALAGVSLLVAAACSAPAPAPAAKKEPPFRKTATIKDIMDSMVDPSADFLWESVATIVTRKGTEERRPRTDDEWKAVRRAAITLIEATNLLIMDGRAVAKPGEKSENPGIELSPEAIRRVMDDDPDTLIKLAGSAARCRDEGDGGDRRQERGRAVRRGRSHRQRLRDLPPQVLVSPGRGEDRGGRQRQEEMKR